MTLRWVIFIIVYLIIDYYAFQAVKTITKKQVAYWFYWVISGLVIGNLFYQMVIEANEAVKVLTPVKSYAFGLVLSLFVPKLILIIFLLGEDFLRVPHAIYTRFFGNKEPDASFMASRRKFISYLALGLAALPFGALLYGMYKGKYNFKVLTYTLTFKDLPPAFHGYKITQISDIHAGSFDNHEKIEYAVNLINEQKSDAIFFTGDLVNNLATEMKPWKSTFGKLRAKDGVFSVLGNHDYGDYVEWQSEEKKKENLDELITIQKEMGYDVLLNDSRFIEREGQRIALIGVENWGKGGFKKAGDLQKASEGVDPNDFKIVLTHDPSHWEAKVVDHPYHYHLTLSGHTHGMQFGIEIPGWFKWSPVSFRYKQWAGIYKKKEQYINVNRGFGYLAYPGRFGIWPEITVIELKQESEIT
ncbi:MAG: metallophosphoesterase [Bizionia sp.]|nr:metallophosphoesterase [Bizionia sp.]